jgi:cation/acetate symporter
MAAGITFTAAYIIYFTFINPDANNAEHWWFGISPEGIGTLGMILNFIVALTVMKFTKEPPQDIQDMVEDIRIPRRLMDSDKEDRSAEE